MSTHVCSRFDYVHFDANWNIRHEPERIVYEPTVNGAAVLVVNTRVESTLVYRITQEERVWVSLDHDIIFLPSPALSRTHGVKIPVGDEGVSP